MGFFDVVTRCLKIFVHIYLKHRKPLLPISYKHTYISITTIIKIDNNETEEAKYSLSPLNIISILIAFV